MHRYEVIIKLALVWL